MLAWQQLSSLFARLAMMPLHLSKLTSYDFHYGDVRQLIDLPSLLVLIIDFDRIYDTKC